MTSTIYVVIYYIIKLDEFTNLLIILELKVTNCENIKGNIKRVELQ